MLFTDLGLLGLDLHRLCMTAIRSTSIKRCSSPTWEDDWACADWVLIYLIVLAFHIINSYLWITFGIFAVPLPPG